MSAPLNRRWVLARRPRGKPVAADFARDDAPLPVPGPGEILVRNVFVPVDPGMLPVLIDVPTGVDDFEPLPLGAPVGYMTVGRVEASNDPNFGVGDWVTDMLLWQDYAVTSGATARRIEPGTLPPQAWLGVLGIPGLSAWTGLVCLGEPQPGETVLVTSAAGTVGSIAGQVAKALGCRVIGVAGGPDKCRRLVDHFGFDAAIDRHADADLAESLRAAAPGGIDILFDNVGNHSVDTVLPLMRRHGRIVICGQIADYHLAPAERTGIVNTNRFVTNRLTMRGLFVYDHAARFAEAEAQLAGWARDGRLRLDETVLDGFTALPDAFAQLFNSGSAGRMIVRIDRDSVSPASARGHLQAHDQS